VSDTKMVFSADKWFDDCIEFMEDSLRDQVQSETEHGEPGVCVIAGVFMYEEVIYKITFDVEWNRYDKQYYYIEGLRFVSCLEYKLTAQEKGTYEMLWDIFGGTINEKGYKVLNPKIGMIYGDSITLDRQERILEKLEAKGFAATNLVLGIGSYTYEYVTRDTFGFAMKATWGTVDGEPRDIYKNPKTDSGFKKSAKGLLRVDEIDGVYKLKDMCTIDEEVGGELKFAFLNGIAARDESFDDIRDRLRNP